MQMLIQHLFEKPQDQEGIELLVMYILKMFIKKQDTSDQFGSAGSMTIAKIMKNKGLERERFNNVGKELL